MSYSTKDNDSFESFGFKALLFSSWCGAFNDNFFKLLISLIVLRYLGSDSASAVPLSLAQAAYVLPFVLLSPLAGALCDRFSKHTVAIISKSLEVLVIICALPALENAHFTTLIVAMFAMGAHSALWSPAKYGSLAELVGLNHLSKANGILEHWSFIAVIAGCSAGALVSGIFPDQFGKVGGLIALGIAILGFVSALFIKHIPAAAPSLTLKVNLLEEFKDTLQQISLDKSLILAIYGVTYFWFLAAFFQMSSLLYARELAHLDDIGTGIMLVALALGAGFGAVLAGKVSEGKVELGLVPLGAIGISLFSSLLAGSYGNLTLTLILTLLLGISSGFFLIPLESFIQRRSPDQSRGRYLACLNVISYSGMLAAALVFWLLNAYVQLAPNHLFLFVGSLTLLVSAFLLRLMPEALARCVNWLLTHSIYMVRVENYQSVPTSGGALLIANHVSFADPALLMATIDRPVRFLMYRDYYNHFLLGPFAKAVGAIPISNHDSPKELLKSLNVARKAIENGELVAIFAEGQLTRIGNLLPFNRGFERMVKGLDVPIIPVHLDQLWGSIFSFKRGKYFWKWPERLPYKVSIRFGEQLPTQTSATIVRAKIQELGSQSYLERNAKWNISQSYLRSTRRHFFKAAISDTSKKNLTFGSLLTLAWACCARLEKTCSHAHMVSVLLPPSVASAIANIALTLLGKVSVNLNYTASSAALGSALKQCQSRTIITSRAFIDKLNLNLDADLIFIEDLIKDISKLELWSRYLKLLLTPGIVWRYWFNANLNRADECATVIFSSGSTGDPKGVMLSHRNVVSNVEAVREVVQLDSSDGIVGVLPFFHSFGFTATLWMPLLSGIKVALHSNPLEAQLIGEMIADKKLTFLMVTPTFLTSFLRRCTKEQLQSLRSVIVGAEKLKPKLAQAFFDKFGITPLEGYGCTELSPVALLNLPGFKNEQVSQLGNKPGSAGMPIPGVAVKVVDPENFSDLGCEVEGLLLVKGPNVMLGYLNNPDKTTEVIRGGWYVTGDIARIDSDGFVTITDRLSRFSKIAGEMVPHVKIEDEMQRALALHDQQLVVIGVPDEKKGERLCVLHKIELNPTEAVAALADAGLPNLWIPKRESFFKVDSFPKLGTGKLDLRALKEIALEKFGGVGIVE